MKRILAVQLLACALLVLLASCAAFPKPQASTDTLVVGSLVLDFPDAFFNDPPRKLDSGVRLDFRNLTTGKDFTLLTGKGGYFYFLSNGTDSFQITSYAYQADAAKGGYYRGSSRLGVKVASQAGCVQYIGHVTYRFTSPSLIKTTGVGTQWHFVTDTLREYRKDEVQAWLQAMAPDSPWLSREIRPDFLH